MQSKGLFIQRPVRIEQAPYGVCLDQMGTIPGMQTADSGEVSYSPYSPVLQDLIEAQRLKLTFLLLIDISITQRNMSPVIGSHCGKQCGVSIYLLLQPMDKAGGFRCIDTIAKLCIDQPEQGGEWLAID